MGKAGTDWGGCEQTLCTSVRCAERGVYYFAPAWIRRMCAVRFVTQGDEMQCFDLGVTEDIDWRN